MALSHLLYTLTVTLGITATIGYYLRARWSGYLPRRVRDRLGKYMALPSFERDVEAGLSSEDFDLSTNVEGGDDRYGLDGTSRAQVRAIMKRMKCTFDQARLIYLQDKMKLAGIDPQTGLPTDSKFVSFSS